MKEYGALIQNHDGAKKDKKAAAYDVIRVSSYFFAEECELYESAADP